MSLVAGTRLGPYEVVSHLGAGGMGEVYRARDTRLDRTVAIKVLPTQTAEDTRRLERFRQEARAVSRLSHPHICTLHDVGEQDGTFFLVMEHVQGRTLAERLEEGALPVGELLRHGVQLAEALHAAHSEGVVHRDLKPANVMLTREGVKLLDFGLARLNKPEEGSDAKTASALTEEGVVLGTLPYMAPEQLEGKKADARTDIFALGIVLYEMATGRRPFVAESRASLIAAILSSEPPPLSTLQPLAPPALEWAVKRCLAKDPEDRWQSAADVAAQLHWIVGEAPAAPPQAVSGARARSIVILPFRDLSPGGDNEYFSDGLMEEVISDLTRVRALRVISRTSSMRLKGTNKDVKTIGRELGVRYVLEGSVRKAGNDLRITVRLVDAEMDAPLWSEKYVGTLDHVFAIQERLSRAIVDALKLELSPSEARAVAVRSIADPRAYECYLRARHEMWRWSRDALDRARQLLERGLAIADDSVLLHATLGVVHLHYDEAGIDLSGGHLEEAERCGARVLTLAPESPHGHRLKGWIEQRRGRTQEAVGHFKQALASDPDNPDTLIALANLYVISGRSAAARPLVARLLEVDPLTPFNHCMPGWIEIGEGRPEPAAAAVAAYRKMCEMDPGNPTAQLFYGWTLAFTGQTQEAAAVLEVLTREASGSVAAELGSHLRHALEGNRDAALAAVSPQLRAAGQRTELWARLLAEGYALVDEADEAVGFLAIAVGKGFINYPFLAHDPFLARLRDRPAFVRLMDQVKSRWERFEV